MDTNLIFEGDFYHVYNRGTNKMVIFHSKEDHLRFQRLMFFANSTKSFQYRNFQNKALKDIEPGDPIVSIVAYTLMPNHFHILLEEKVPGGKEMFMRKLCTGYSMYYNKIYDHSGNVFQGRSKSKLIDTDEYFEYLSIYIHLNPVKIFDAHWKLKLPTVTRIESFLRAYPYSSYLDFVGASRDENVIITKDENVRKMFEVNPSQMCKDWLETGFTEVAPQ